MFTQKSDIAQHRQLSASIEPERINAYLNEAEELDLIPLIGEPLYLAIDNKPDDYADLLNKTVYTTASGSQRLSAGLRRVVAHFAFARYRMFGDDTDTPFGALSNLAPNTIPIGRERRKEWYVAERQTALSHWLTVKNYLNEKASQYPLWNAKHCGHQRPLGKLIFLS